MVCCTFASISFKKLNLFLSFSFAKCRFCAIFLRSVSVPIIRAFPTGSNTNTGMRNIYLKRQIL